VAIAMDILKQPIGVDEVFEGINGG